MRSAPKRWRTTSTSDDVGRRQRARIRAITDDDLAVLVTIAAADRADRFARRPRWAVYADRVIAVALCQGAALHHVDGKSGVKDFDVWTFYAEHDAGPFPPRWKTEAVFGGEHSAGATSSSAFAGRRVDLLGRSLRESVDADAAGSLVRYLEAGATDSARRLSEKAVVLLDPRARRSDVVWPR